MGCKPSPGTAATRQQNHGLTAMPSSVVLPGAISQPQQHHEAEQEPGVAPCWGWEAEEHQTPQTGAFCAPLQPFMQHMLCFMD